MRFIHVGKWVWSALFFVSAHVKVSSLPNFHHSYTEWNTMLEALFDANVMKTSNSTLTYTWWLRKIYITLCLVIISRTMQKNCPATVWRHCIGCRVNWYTISFFKTTTSVIHKCSLHSDYNIFQSFGKHLYGIAVES